MSLVAQFKDGKFVTDTASSNSLSQKNDTNSSKIDSEAFLTLLVAEMQNQDPLEPTSNTEWVSQYATFTQVSEIQEIGKDMQGVKAQDLVGEYVIMKVTGETGETDYVSGKVDYVVYEEGKAYLSIDDSLYSIDDLDTVASSEYMEAYDKATELTNAFKELPLLDNLTTSSKKAVMDLYDEVSELTSYEKGFVNSTMIDEITKYYDKMIKLLDAEEAERQALEKEKVVEKVVEKEVIVEKEVPVEPTDEISDEPVEEGTDEIVEEPAEENAEEVAGNTTEETNGQTEETEETIASEESHEDVREEV